MNEWIARYAYLVGAQQWDALIDHVRDSVNTSKEVLLSVDPAVQKQLHDALRIAQQVKD